MNYYCACGAVLRGNGAKASHRKKYEKAGAWEARASMRTQGQHGLLTMDQFRDKFPDVDLRGSRR